MGVERKSIKILIQYRCKGCGYGGYKRIHVNHLASVEPTPEKLVEWTEQAWQENKFYFHECDKTQRFKDGRIGMCEIISIEIEDK